MKAQLVRMYLKCRKAKPFMLTGQDAKCSLATAKTILEFRQLESDGLVRMRSEEEQESYFVVFGDDSDGAERNGHPIDAKQARKETEEMLERYGVWWTCSEWFDGDEWQEADSCGMHAGYKDPLDPFENCYVVGEMQAAIDALKSHQDSIAFETNESQAMACRDIATV